MKKSYFTPAERLLWGGSAAMIVLAFCLFDRESWLTLAASLVGVTSLIFCAKGNPFGQALMILFSLIYGVISYSFAYYGEMITYVGMTMPMAVFSLIAWLKNPYQGNRAEVAVHRLRKNEWALLAAATMAVTVVFYFSLAALGTANLIPSTISVTTSCLAVLLTYKRSPFFAAAYAANDLVLIVLWGLAALEDLSYLSVFVCFAAFFVNDLYGFRSWTRMEKRQFANTSACARMVAAEQEDR